MSRVYLYGITEGGGTATVATTGIDGVNPVYTITQNGLGCVVSDYGGEELRALARERLVRGLLAHQQVVERIMQDQAVLPVQFGTLLDGSQEVQGLLAQGRSELARALVDIRDRVEVEVAATWDTGRVLQEAGREEAIVRAREAITSAGQPTLEQRLRMGQLVKACLDRRRDSYREQMVAFLRPLSLDVAPNALLSDAMVMNVAFLVHKAQQERFSEGVQRLDKLFYNEVTFRVIGPLPPYSFSTVEVAPLTPGQVEEARERLHLGGPMSQAGVRSAYRRLAAEGQRRTTGDGQAQAQLSELRRAAETLLCYCRARGGAERDRQPHATTDQNGGRLFSLAIRRSHSDEIEAARFGGGARVQE